MSISILCFCFALILPFIYSLHFNITRFNQDSPEISYQGDARANGAVELTNADYTCRSGWATYGKRIPLWDPETGKPSDFTTRFSFRIDTRGFNYGNYGHGFAFFLAPAGIQMPPNSAGGFLALFNETNVKSSSHPLVHVEFDTYSNPEWDPLDVKSHVGINNNSLISSNVTSWNATSHDQDIARVVILYDSSRRNLSVSWTYDTTYDPKEDSTLSYIIDLSKVLPSEVTVGFSATSGGVTEGNILLSWEYSSSLELSVIKKVQNGRKGMMIIGVSVSLFVLLTFFIVFLKRKLQLKKKKDEETANLTSINDDLERGAGPRKFSYKDLVIAANNFSDDRKLGEGGFGAVYKGYMSGLDMMVAIKKFAGGCKQQGKREFVTEVKIISSLRHRNLVQLIGWCHEKDEFLMVYEFMPNGSLDDSHLFGKKPRLAWSVRCKVTLGIASALMYLHEEWEQCVVHRDIKASNVMLDSNFNARLGDFGLARLMDHELGPQTTGLAGTFGYMAPEYISTGRASKESDVYSFGVVTLEIVTGRKAVDPRQGRVEPETSLVEKVWELYGKGEVMITGIDETLRIDGFDEKQAECLVVVGLWCAHPDRNSRPSIKQAIQVLNREAPLPRLPIKMPVATYHVSSSSSTGTSVSSGGATATFSSAQLGR